MPTARPDSQPEFSEIVIVGGGPMALSLSAMLAQKGQEHVIIYPDQDDPQHTYSSQAGKYRQFSAFSNLSEKLLIELRQFYQDRPEINIVPVTSTMIFREEKDFLGNREKFLGKDGIEEVNISELPIEDSLEDCEPFYPTALIQRNGAFNIEIASLSRYLKKTSDEYATHINGKLQHIINNDDTTIISLSDGRSISTKKVIVAAGPHTGALLTNNVSVFPGSNMETNKPDPRIKDIYNVMAAPTTTYNLGQNSKFKDKPHNYLLIENRGIFWTFFNCGDGTNATISLFDLNRSIDLIEQLPEYKKQQYFEYYELTKSFDDTEENKILFQTEIDNLRFKMQEILGTNISAKDTGSLPTHVANEEIYYIGMFADVLHLDVEPEKYGIAPYTTTKTGSPILGPVANNIYAAFGGNGGAYKDIFGDTFNSQSGIMFEKLNHPFGEINTKSAEQFETERGDDMYRLSELTAHLET